MAWIKSIGGGGGQTTIIPDGKTVTPINSIGRWQQCAGLEVVYSTLSSLLADSTTVSALMADDNAVDYLVRSTSFASTITANNTAMTYIGQNNYASNTLLADVTWCQAICTSAYFTRVLNVKVPTMTSNTAPSGEVYADSTYSGRYPYYACNGKSLNLNDGTTFWFPGSDTTHFISYKFTKDVKCYRMTFKTQTDGGSASMSVKFRASNDRSTWVDLTSQSATVDTSQRTYTLIKNNTTAYRYYSLSISRQRAISELQFYGREDV